MKLRRDELQVVPVHSQRLYVQRKQEWDAIVHIVIDQNEALLRLADEVGDEGVRCLGQTDASLQRR